MVKKFVSILVALLFAFSTTAITLAVEKRDETSSKVEKGSPTMGEKKAESPAMMKKEATEKGTKKVHKAKKIKRAKKLKKAKKPIKKSSTEPSTEGIK